MFAELILSQLRRDAQGTLALSASGADTLRRTLSAIADPVAFKDALAELVDFACFLGTAAQQLSASRALLRLAEGLCVRLVAIGAAPSGFGPDAKNTLDSYRRLLGDDRPKSQLKANSSFQPMKVKEVLSWRRIK